MSSKVNSIVLYGDGFGDGYGYGFGSGDGFGNGDGSGNGYGRKKIQPPERAKEKK